MPSYFKDPPVRNKRYRDWVKTLPCCMTNVEPAGDCHHLVGVGNEGGMGIKACDLLTMPLTRKAHAIMHQDPELWPDQWQYIAKTLQRAIKDGIIRDITLDS